MKPDNKDFANQPEIFANASPLQVTLRELQSIFTSPRFWIGFAAVTAILAIIGPFNTQARMDFPTRLVYWAVICLAAYLIGMATSVLIGTIIFQHGWSKWVSRLLGALVAGVPIGAVIWSININLFQLDTSAKYAFVEFLGFTTAISVLVTIIGLLLSTRHSIDADIHSSGADPSFVFFDRLPRFLGREIISLEAQDHYINVKTTKGTKLVLLRLGDAEKELASVPGLRVHRSWWVAVDAVEKVIRKNGRTELVLKDGSTVPVSRSHLKTIAEAGIK